MKKSVFFLILFILLTAFCVSQEKRVALVIGNANYIGISPLTNPINDAEDMTKTLEKIGFDVITLIDADERTMARGIRDFGGQLLDADVGLFYYAGHGMQVNRINYLIPVGADIQSEDDVEFEAVEADRVMAKMESSNTKTNIIIMDACRDNPFQTGTRSASRGLSVVSAPTGTIVIYATSPGETAADGDGRNGVLTAAMLKYIQTPGLEIESMMKKVRMDVGQATSQKQTPWSTSSLRTDFFFMGEEAVKRVGLLKVSVLEEGSLYLDGLQVQAVMPGEPVFLEEIEEGSRKIEIRYQNSSETQTANVHEGQITEIVFSYREPAKVQAGTIIFSNLPTDSSLHINDSYFNVGSAGEMRIDNQPAGEVLIRVTQPFSVSEYQQIIVLRENETKMMTIPTGRFVLENIPDSVTLLLNGTVISGSCDWDSVSGTCTSPALLEGAYSIDVEGEYIDPVNVSLNVSAGYDSRKRLDIVEYGILEIKHGSSEPQDALFSFFSRSGELKSEIMVTHLGSAAVRIPKGEYTLKGNYINDVDYSFQQDIVVLPAVKKPLIIDSMEYSPSFRIKKLENRKFDLIGEIDGIQRKEKIFKYAGIGFLSAGVLASIVGVVSYSKGVSAWEDYDSALTTPEALDARQSAESFGSLFTISLGGGAGCLSAGTLFMILKPSERKIQEEINTLDRQIELLREGN
jgi:hypothetical protein